MPSSTGPGRVRAACFEIGWLETSLPAVATESICAIETLLASGAQPGSDAVRDRVRVFEAGLENLWPLEGRSPERSEGELAAISIG